jgi:hypothetical protein
VKVDGLAVKMKEACMPDEDKQIDYQRLVVPRSDVYFRDVRRK